MSDDNRPQLGPHAVAPARHGVNEPLRRSHLPPLASSPSVGQDEGQGTADSLQPQSNAPAQAGDSGAGPSGAFRPSEAQSRVKSRFWSRWAGGSAGLQLLTSSSDPEKVTLAAAQSVTGSSALAAWWVRPGFKDWFLNTQATEEKVDHLLFLALSAAEEILTNPDPRAQSARVSMIKTVAEMAGRLGATARAAASAAPSAQDRKIQAIEKMNPAELKEFLKAAGVDIQTVLTLPA